MVKGLNLAALLLALLPLVSVVGQKKILGDISEQRISQIYDEDAREEKVYRRPPTYLIIASRIVRPSTVYQVRGELFKNANAAGFPISRLRISFEKRSRFVRLKLGLLLRR